MSSFDWYLDRVVHFERPDTLTVDHDIERATTDLHSDRLMRQLESCRHLRSPFCVRRSAVASCFDHEGVTSGNRQWEMSHLVAGHEALAPSQTPETRMAAPVSVALVLLNTATCSATP
jgi:hypothetical protein